MTKTNKPTLKGKEKIRVKRIKYNYKSVQEVLSYLYHFPKTTEIRYDSERGYGFVIFEKLCNCQDVTSSFNSVCEVCGGSSRWKSERAEKDFRKYVKDELKKPCKLCGSKMEHFMCNCVSAFACTNVKCKNHDIPPGTFGKCGPSTSITTKQTLKEVLKKIKQYETQR